MAERAHRPDGPDRAARRPVLVLVAGHPATGKSTAAAHLSRALCIPAASKDAVKERIFDAVGWSDRAWSEKVGDAAVVIMADQARAALASGHDVVVESVFDRPGEVERLVDAVQETGAGCVVVVFQAFGDDVLERYRRRNLADRHPGHADDEEDPELEEKVCRPYPPPAVPGALVVELDHSDVDGVDLDELTGVVAAAVRQAGERP